MTDVICLATKLTYTTDPKLPPNVLQEMVKTAKSHRISKVPGRIGLDAELHSDQRSSGVYFMCWDSWIAGILHNIFISANNDFFHFDLDHFDTGIQTTYYEEGDHYTWHNDARSNQTPTGYERKLSMSFLLTDDYEGGELELEAKPFHKTFKPKAGTALIFPSWLPHRVKPVTSGERISLVTWMNGPYFK